MYNMEIIYFICILVSILVFIRDTNAQSKITERLMNLYLLKFKSLERVIKL